MASLENRNVTGNSVALRVVKHRSSHVRLDVSVSLRTGASIDGLASQFDCSRSEVVRSLLRWALSNRDWKTQGLLWRDG
jgi:metal-responsive CopG/Arc/MetJ family transcriptional regulator